MLISRPRALEAIANSVRRNPVTAILGPRQCGKTTLAREVADSFSGQTTFLDLEDDVVAESLRGHAKHVLEALSGLIIIDEVQHRPELFRLLRVLADRRPAPAKFLVLGSASPDLLQQSSESLAGRIEYVELSGFDCTEVALENLPTLWTRGGFPRSFLAETEDDSLIWRDQFIRTFLERDVAALGFRIPALTLRRFLNMVAHYHGQVWNNSEVGGSLGVDDMTARKYLDLMAGAYVARLLPPWFENLGKRQRKAPKVYLRDTGVLHALLSIQNHSALMSHPKCGASWEGFAIEQILRILQPREAYYWSVHSGPELDLLVFHNGQRIGFEFKLSDTPSVTSSMLTAQQDLKLDKLWVIYPGQLRFPLAEGIEALPLALLAETLLPKSVSKQVSASRVDATVTSSDLKNSKSRTTSAKKSTSKRAAPKKAATKRSTK